MFTRRTILAAAAATVALSAPAFADWKAQYPELVYAVVPAENASGVTERFTPWVEYLSKELGVKVTLRIANDYAAVIEGQKAGTIHIGNYGPSAFVRAYTVTDGGVLPFVTNINADGSTGYYSVAYVKADSPVKELKDLAGKNLCLVDPNSTSGNNVPRFAMDKMGMDPEKFFGKVVYAGSHENVITALAQGTCDVGFNWWNSEEDTNLMRMDRKGMAKAADFKIVFKSDLIPGSPDAFLKSLPEDLRAAIAKAYQDAPTKDKAAFDRLSDGKWKGFAPVTVDTYKVTFELQKFVDALRKKSS
ncbi:MAG: phosphonate ABC transporter substrate-binding protein [Labrys sp. (in: a-proteobacteria)]